MNLFIKVLSLSFISTITTACSQTQSKPKNVMELETDKSQILEVARHLTLSMINRDLRELNKILDADFTLTHITGYVQSRKEWLSEIESESMKYYSYKEVKTTVKIEENKAIFVGQNLLDARIWGSRNTWRLQQTMQLEKREGKWIILKSVATTF